LRVVPDASPVPVNKPSKASLHKKSLSDPSLQKKTTTSKPEVESSRKETSLSVPSESPSRQGYPPLSQGFRWYCCVDGCPHSRIFIHPDLPPPPLKRGRGLKNVVDDTRRWKIPRGNPCNNFIHTRLALMRFHLKEKHGLTYDQFPPILMKYRSKEPRV
jgi:hypothetical protein